MMYPSLATGKVIATRAIAVTRYPEINVVINGLCVCKLYVMYVFYICLYYFAPEKTAAWEMIRLPFGRNGLFSEANLSC